MFNKLKDFTNKVINGRNELSPKVQNILKSAGDVQVVSIITGTLNLINFKSTPFDTLFHLGIIFTLQNGQRVLLEKNEVINMDINPPNRSGSEFLNVNGFQGKTINQIIQNTKNLMGGKFIPYSAYDNNCQNFILSVLKSNGTETQENNNWVKQNTEYLFSHNPSLRKFANTVTDIAGRFDVIKQGGKCGKGLTLHAGNKISRNNGLSSLQLNKLMEGIKNYNGVYSKDKLPKTLKNGWYIINMQNYKDGNGTHWTCFLYRKGKSIIYYDALGFVPPLEICKVANNNIIWTNKPIQNDISTACGWFCVGCIKFDYEYTGTPENKFKTFINMFSNDNKKNDKVLKSILTNI